MQSSTRENIIGNITLAEVGASDFNQADLAISAIFLFIFIVLALLITGMGIHQRMRKDRLKRNQKIMIGLILIMLIVQCIGITSRIVLDGLTLSIISRAEIYISQNYATNSSVYSDTFVFGNSSILLTDAGVKASELIGMNVANTFEVAFCLSNLSLFLLIMAFVGNVFLETVKLASGDELFSKQAKTFSIVFNIFTALFATTFVVLAVTISIVMTFFRLRLLEDFQVYIYIAGFLIFAIQIVLQIIATTVSYGYSVR